MSGGCLRELPNSLKIKGFNVRQDKHSIVIFSIFYQDTFQASYGRQIHAKRMFVVVFYCRIGSWIENLSRTLWKFL